MNALLKYEDSVSYILSMKHTSKEGEHGFTHLYIPPHLSCDLLEELERSW